MIESAIAVISQIQGAKVFRLAPSSKTPLAKGWQSESTDEIEEIEELWRCSPHANIGIDTEKSELIVVDVDNGRAKDGTRKQGDASYAELTGRNGGHLDTFTVRTWSGGLHHYYRAPEGNTVPSSVSRIAKDIDIRARGGLTVAPGSVFEGVLYEVVNDAPVAECPRWIFEELSKIDETKAARRELSREAARAGQGLAGPEESAAHASAIIVAAGAAPEGTGNDAFSRVAFALGCMTRFGQFGDDLDAIADRYYGEMERAVEGWTFHSERDRVSLYNTMRSQFNAGFDLGDRPWLSREAHAAARSSVSTPPQEPAPVGVPAATRVAVGVFPELVAERTLPSPSQPDDVARELLDLLPNTDGIPHFRSHMDTLYAWNGLRWAPDTSSRLRGMIRAATTAATYVGRNKKGEPTVYPWAPTVGRVNEVLASFTDYLYLSDDAPTVGVAAFLNGVIDGDGELRPHSPSNFNLGNLDFNYDKNAECPQFLAFLESILPGDEEAVRLLQEWFGYVVSGRLDQQKALALIGPPRCGKGTISKIMKELVGAGSYVTPRLNGLTGNFGLQPFIGRSLAVFEDVRWNGVHGCESELLSITAGDSVCVARKNLTSWDGVLPSRVVLISNDAPTFSDPSGALPGRLVTVSIKRSFLGHEDTTLGARLIGEMPGIYNWAVAGLRGLDRRGRFTAPASSAAMVESIRELSSPVAAFVDDVCEVGPEHRVVSAELYVAYKQWCFVNGQSVVSAQLFGRQLRSAVYGLPDREKKRVGGVSASIQPGIRVARAS